MSTYFIEFQLKHFFKQNVYVHYDLYIEKSVIFKSSIKNFENTLLFKYVTHLEVQMYVFNYCL